MISAVFVVHVRCRVAEKEIEAMPICVNLWICKYSHRAKPLKNVFLKRQSTYSPGATFCPSIYHFNLLVIGGMHPVT